MGPDKTVKGHVKHLLLRLLEWEVFPLEFIGAAHVQKHLQGWLHWYPIGLSSAYFWKSVSKQLDCKSMRADRCPEQSGMLCPWPTEGTGKFPHQTRK